MPRTPSGAERDAPASTPARRKYPAGIHPVLDSKGKQVQVVDVHGQRLPKWRIRVYDRRTRTQPEWTVTGTLADAERFLAKQKGDRDLSAQPLSLPRLRLVDYLPIHLERYSRKSDGSPRPMSTWKKHAAMLNTYLVPALGEHVAMRDITTKMLVDAVRDLRKIPTKEQAAARQPGDPVSSWTRSTVAGSARTFFRDAVRDGVIKDNPAELLPVGWGQRSDRRGQVEPSLKDVELLAGAMDEVWPEVLGGDIVRLFAYAGPRMEELVALKADRVFPERRTARISRTATESGGRREWRSASEEAEDLESGIGVGMKTANAARDIVLTGEAMQAVARLEARRRAKLAEEGEREATRAARRAAAERSGRGRSRSYVPPEQERWTLLVTNQLGGPLSYSTWRRKLKLAKALLEERGTPVTYTAHELRHVCASLLITSGGATPDQVRNQMGHATEAFTKRVYGHLWPSDLTDLALRVDARISHLRDAERSGRSPG